MTLPRYLARVGVIWALTSPDISHRALQGYRDPMSQRNVLGGELASCSFNPMTGYYRTGCCESRGDDPGVHVVCVRVTEDFLTFSQGQGNDLSTPMPQYGFAGLKDGDQWCLCASRWQEAFEAGVAPKVVLEATHMLALEFCNLADLRTHAIS